MRALISRKYLIALVVTYFICPVSSPLDNLKWVHTDQHMPAGSHSVCNFSILTFLVVYVAPLYATAHMRAIDPCQKHCCGPGISGKGVSWTCKAVKYAGLLILVFVCAYVVACP